VVAALKLTRVEFTNLGKVLFPALGVTKKQVIEYYIRIAPRLLGILKDRPLSLKRFPDGIGEEGFFEKDAPKGTPPWVKTYRMFSGTAQRDINYILCNDLDTLAWIANLAALEIHMPLSRSTNLEMPDFAFFDVDPEPPLGFDDTIKVTLILKEYLDQLGLVSFVKTSGKKGLHVLVPLLEGYSFKQTRDFVHAVGVLLTKESDIIVSEFPQSQKPGTVFIDYMQNSHARTMASPYSLRATEKATVSTPLNWGDLKKGICPEDFTIFNVQSLGDPWEGIMEARQKLELE
jgi:bifunctional non-homologous end joining protein LigD